MDWNQLEQLRVKGFTLARRGYDTREVDKFLHMLADWLETDAATELGDQAVQRKLELVGKSTAHILLTTEKEAQELRRTTEAECADLRAKADAAAQDTRQKADEYAATTRSKADDAAQRTRESAAEHARKTIDEGDRRRAAIEAVVSDLEAQRDAAVADLERLRGELLTTITKHSTRTAPEARPTEGRRKRANTEPKAEAEVTG
jgi:DivIVA domain-containing protein